MPYRCMLAFLALTVTACTSAPGEEQVGESQDEVTLLRCRDALPDFSAGDRAAYDTFFEARHRPKSDADLRWREATASERELVSLMKLPAPTFTGEALMNAMDLLPMHRPDAKGTNLSIFRELAKAGPLGQDAYFALDPRSYVPGAFTDYGALAPSMLRFQATRTKQAAELVGLALAKCPSCVDGIVTLPGRAEADPERAHDFYKIFEIRLLTDRKVDATDAASKDQPAEGKLYISKPMKVAAVVDVSGSLAAHSRAMYGPFQSSALRDEKLNYRGELTRYMYNLAQTGDPNRESGRRTGTVGALIRYAYDNRREAKDVCNSIEVAADDGVCDIDSFQKWRCKTVESNGQVRYYSQVCRAKGDAGQWLTNSTQLSEADCSVCNTEETSNSCLAGSGG